MNDFSASNDTTKKMERQLAEWEKTFAGHFSNQEFVSRMYYSVFQPMMTTANPIKKWPKNPNSHFSKEDT